MRKIVLNSFSSSLFCLFLLFNSFTVNAQDCIDYDKARYPITVSLQTGNTQFEWNPIWNFTNLKQKKISGLNIASNFKGLLEYLPTSYTAPGNSTKKYPVIIFFHGFGSRGTGTATELCKLFKDRGSDLATHLAIPGRVERSTALFTQNSGETTQEFI